MVAFSTAPSLNPGTNALFAQPGALIHIAPTQMNSAQAMQLAPSLHSLLQLPLRFEPGVMGYGFTMSGTNFIVLEDARNLGRTTQVRLRATPGTRSAQACEVNDHHPLALRRDGAWWLIDTPLRPGDGQLIALDET